MRRRMDAAGLRQYVPMVRHLAMPAAYCVFTMLVFWRLWTPIDGAAATFKYDPVKAYWADLIFQVDSLKAGVFPLWNPHDRGGFPIYGDPQPGALYPANWPLWALALCTGKASYWLVELKIVAHWVFGLVGMHLFLRRRSAPEAACYVGALIFGFSEPAIRYGGNALNWSYAWIPWVLLATQWFADHPSRRRGVILGTSVAMPLLAGAPAVFLYMLVVAIPLGLYLLRDKLRDSLVPLLIAIAVFVAWVLPLLLGNADQVPASVRAVRDLDFVTYSTFTPSQMAYVLLPRLGLYYGFFALAVTIVWALFARGLALVLALTAIVGVLLALGQSADLLAATASALPPFTFFRRAHRFLYVVSVAVACGTGLGLTYLLRLQDEGLLKRISRAVTWLGGLWVAIVGVGLIAAYASQQDLVSERNDSFALAIVSAAIAVVLVRGLVTGSERRRVCFAWAAAVFVAADLWIAYGPVHGAGYDVKPGTVRDSKVLALESLDHYRIYNRGFVRYRPGVRMQIRDFGGYEDDPLSLERYQLFRRAALKDPRILAHANVKYVYQGYMKPKIALAEGHGLTRPRKKRPLWVFDAPAPQVYYVPNAKRVDDARAAVAALAELTPGRDAVIEGVTPPQGNGEATAGRVVSTTPNRVELEITTPGPGVIVFTDAYFEPWQATVDGHETPIWPTNGMFRGVIVDTAGTHRVTMVLRPMAYYIALVFYGMAILLVLGLGAVAARRVGRRLAP